MTVPDVDRLIPETPEHPYLFFSKSDVDRVRALCLEGSHAEIYRQTRERLNAHLDHPFPMPPPREESYRNGVWETYSRLSGEARSLLEDYVLAYAVDRDQAYFEKAWEGLASMMSWPSWVHRSTNSCFWIWTAAIPVPVLPLLTTCSTTSFPKTSAANSNS